MPRVPNQQGYQTTTRTPGPSFADPISQYDVDEYLRTGTGPCVDWYALDEQWVDEDRAMEKHGRDLRHLTTPVELARAA